MIKKLLHLIFVVLILALVVGVPVSWMIRRSYSNPEVHYFRAQEDGDRENGQALRFAVISDLNDYVFEGGNGVISELVGSTSPDAILLGGNMISKDAKSLTPVTDLIRSLVQTAPVYYAYGSEELKYAKEHSRTSGTGEEEDELRAALESAGAVVLNDEYKDVVIYGVRTRIGAMNGKAYELTDLSGKVKRKYEKNWDFLNRFQDTDSFKVMLLPGPENFVYSDAAKTWDIDLVVSGGGLGGLAVLPRYGGVFGASGSYFPEYVHGIYEKEGVNILITSGLSAPHTGIPRFNNPPEVAVLDLSGIEIPVKEEKTAKEEKEKTSKEEKPAEEEKSAEEKEKTTE